MTELRQGGCQCGKVRFEIDFAQCLTLYCCHCLECQRQAASAFGMSLIIPGSAFRLVTGELSEMQRKGGSGMLVSCRFCPDCGVRIYHELVDPADSDLGLFSLKAGTLDDKGGLNPIGHIWTKRALPWLKFAPDAVIYEGDPKVLDRLAAAWQRQGAGS